MDKIRWCAEKKEGLSLIEPNSDLANAYIKKAEEALESMRINVIKDWKISTAYYTIYFSLYAVLMKIGVKCEIHSCTIEIVQLREKEKIIDFEFSKVLEEDKELRIDNQYYLKNKPVDFNSKKLSDILLKIRNILNNITDTGIKRIRKLI